MPTPMRRHSTSEKELRALIKRMNATSGRTYGLASQITAEYAGTVRYRHCLTETVGGAIHKRSAWKSSHAALLDYLQLKVRRAA